MKKCRVCNRKLRNYKSIQRGIGPTCERKYLEDLYKKKQISIDDILQQKKGENEYGKRRYKSKSDCYR